MRNVRKRHFGVLKRASLNQQRGFSAYAAYLASPEEKAVLS